MRRTLAVIGFVGVLTGGSLVLAGPAAAERTCSFDPSTGVTTCHGGRAESSTGGGGAGHRSTESLNGDYSFSGGAGVPGGGYGEHCTGNRLDYTQRCVGSGHHP